MMNARWGDALIGFGVRGLLDVVGVDVFGASDGTFVSPACSCLILARVLLIPTTLGTPFFPASATTGNTDKSPSLAATSALVLLADMYSDFVTAEGGRREILDPQSWQVDLGLGLVLLLVLDGIRAPVPSLRGVGEGEGEGTVIESDTEVGSDGIGISVTVSSAGATGFPFPLPFALPFLTGATAGVCFLTLSCLTLTTFHPYPSLNHPQRVQHQPRLLPTGRSTSRRIRAVYSADSSGARGFISCGMVERNAVVVVVGVMDVAVSRGVNGGGGVGAGGSGGGGVDMLRRGKRLS